MGGWLSQPAHSCALTLQFPVGKDEEHLWGICQPAKTGSWQPSVSWRLWQFHREQGLREEWHNHNCPWLLCNKFLLCAITMTSKPAGRTFPPWLTPQQPPQPTALLLQLSLEPAAAELPVQRGLGLLHVQQPLESKQTSMHFPGAIQTKPKLRTDTHTPQRQLCKLLMIAKQCCREMSLEDLSSDP